MTDKGKHIKGYLPAQLVREMRRHQQDSSHLHEAWNRVAPAELADKAEPAGYSEGVLTLKVISPTWAARIRLYSDDILNRLRELDEFNGLQALRIKVRPGSSGDDRDYEIQEERVSYERKARRLSAQAAEVLEAAADAIEDQELKQALKRLSKRNK